MYVQEIPLFWLKSKAFEKGGIFNTSRQRVLYKEAGRCPKSEPMYTLTHGIKMFAILWYAQEVLFFLALENHLKTSTFSDLVVNVAHMERCETASKSKAIHTFTHSSRMLQKIFVISWYA